MEILAYRSKKGSLVLSWDSFNIYVTFKLLLLFYKKQLFL